MNVIDRHVRDLAHRAFLEGARRGLAIGFLLGALVVWWGK